MSASAEPLSESERAEASAPLCEPEIIHALFIDGISVESAGAGVFRFTGWQTVDGERRVVSRFVMTDWAARKLVAQLQGSFGPQH